MSGNELVTETIMGAVGALVISLGVAVCCRLRRRLRAPEGTPLPPPRSSPPVVPVQPTAPPSPVQQRYVVYLPPTSYYPQTQLYPPQTPSYLPQMQPYPPHFQPTYTNPYHSQPY